ncbi:MAG: DUF11 domain-containing protein [Candidatus Doudnabacteria bacterium]|nr:DUF11 domain-containing protein [Candidatus Doudnabacteria bacterium]
MSNLASRQNTKRLGVPLAFALILAVIISVFPASQAAHNTTSEDFDTGWMVINSFPGQLSGNIETDCAGIKYGNVYGKHNMFLQVSNFDTDIPAGKYAVDIKARYGYYRGAVHAPQNNETMRIRTSVDSKNVSDLNGATGVYDKEDCADYRQGIDTYLNVTGSPIEYQSGPIRFEGLNNTSQSIKIYAIRLHGGTNLPDLRCAPATQEINVGQTATLTASGGTGQFQWSAASGSPVSGLGRTFSTSYASAGNFDVILTSGNQTDACRVTVRANQQTVAQLSINKQVRNVSRGTAFTDSVSASPSEQVEFRITVSASGNTAAVDVRLNDVLPNNFNLIYTNVDSGVGISSPTSFSLGNMNPGSSKTVWIGATAASASNFPIGDTTWVNTATTYANNVSTFSDSALVLVSRSGGGSFTPFLNINKQARNLSTGASFGDSATARQGDRVEFRITVSNNGSGVATNVRVNDVLPNQLSLVSGSVRLDGSTSFSGDLFINSLFLGDLNSGNSRSITFETTVPANTGNILVTNIAYANANNASTVNDLASVSISQIQILGGNVDLVLSKRAFNQTKNQNAIQVTATAGDLIVYTLTVENRGNTASGNFVVEEDLFDVLQLAELVDFSGAQFDLARHKLTWPGQTIAAAGRIEKTFSVRVRSQFPAGTTDFVMTNVYGNRVDVNVARPQVAGVFIAPKTGSKATLSFGLSALVLIGFAAIRRYRQRPVVS